MSIFKYFLEKEIIKMDKNISKYNYSYMCNSKWEKIFLEILKNRNIITDCLIVDHTNGTVNRILWDKVLDTSKKYIHHDYISEEITQGEYPTPYKYIEYIEFPKKYKTKFSVKKSNQDVDKIKNILSQIGIFEWEEDDMTLKLIGYR